MPKLFNLLVFSVPQITVLSSKTAFQSLTSDSLLWKTYGFEWAYNKIKQTSSHLNLMVIGGSNIEAAAGAALSAKYPAFVTTKILKIAEAFSPEELSWHIHHLVEEVLEDAVLDIQSRCYYVKGSEFI